MAGRGSVARVWPTRRARGSPRTCWTRSPPARPATRRRRRTSSSATAAPGAPRRRPATSTSGRAAFDDALAGACADRPGGPRPSTATSAASCWPSVDGDRRAARALGRRRPGRGRLRRRPVRRAVLGDEVGALEGAGRAGRPTTCATLYAVAAHAVAAAQLGQPPSTAPPRATDGKSGVDQQRRRQAGLRHPARASPTRSWSGRGRRASRATGRRPCRSSWSAGRVSVPPLLARRRARAASCWSALASAPGSPSRPRRCSAPSTCSSSGADGSTWARCPAPGRPRVADLLCEGGPHLRARPARGRRGRRAVRDDGAAPGRRRPAADHPRRRHRRTARLHVLLEEDGTLLARWLVRR